MLDPNQWVWCLSSWTQCRSYTWCLSRMSTTPSSLLTPSVTSVSLTSTCPLFPIWQVTPQLWQSFWTRLIWLTTNLKRHSQTMGTPLQVYSWGYTRLNLPSGLDQLPCSLSSTLLISSTEEKTSKSFIWNPLITDTGSSKRCLLWSMDSLAIISSLALWLSAI